MPIICADWHSAPPLPHVESARFALAPRHFARAAASRTIRTGGASVPTSPLNDSRTQVPSMTHTDEQSFSFEPPSAQSERWSKETDLRGWPPGAVRPTRSRRRTTTCASCTTRRSWHPRTKLHTSRVKGRVPPSPQCQLQQATLTSNQHKAVRIFLHAARINLTKFMFVRHGWGA